MKAGCEDLEYPDYLDWQFIAEGRLHVVFFNQNKRSINYNAVLKIPKVRAGKKCKQDQAFYEYDAFMVRSIMTNWFSKGYIQDIVQLTLSESFLEYIINTYYLYGSGRSKTLLLAPYAYIERNLLKVMQPIPPSHTHYLWTRFDRVISFEFKVKCGLKSISPFNKTSRRLKLKYSRFTMMQALKARKRDISIGDCAELSVYCPQKLCSKESDVVFSCLKSLLQNPQNNLKVSLNGQHKFGWGKTDITVLHNISSSFLSPSLSGTRSSIEKERDSDFVLSLVCKILSENALLIELQSMQLLDILDSEGAAIIYGKLVEEVGSSTVADESILERIASPDFGSVVVPDLIAFSREVMASGKYNLDDNTIGRHFSNGTHGSHPDLSGSSSVSSSSAGDVMRALLQLAIHEGMSEEEILSYSTAAFEVVQDLRKDVCVDLLVAWFMGLIAKDASVIVSLQPMRPMAGADASERNMEKEFIEIIGSGQEDHFGSSTVVSPLMNYYSCIQPTEHFTGVLGVNNGTSAPDKFIHHLPSFAYSIGVIDVGMKPLDKIYKRYLEEESLIQAAHFGFHQLNSEELLIIKT